MTCLHEQASLSSHGLGNVFVKSTTGYLGKWHSMNRLFTLCSSQDNPSNFSLSVHAKLSLECSKSSSPPEEIVHLSTNRPRYWFVTAAPQEESKFMTVSHRCDLIWWVVRSSSIKVILHGNTALVVSSSHPKTPARRQANLPVDNLQAAVNWPVKNFTC